MILLNAYFHRQCFGASPCLVAIVLLSQVDCTAVSLRALLATNEAGHLGAR